MPTKNPFDMARLFANIKQNWPELISDPALYGSLHDELVRAGVEGLELVCCEGVAGKGPARSTVVEVLLAFQGALYGRLVLTTKAEVEHNMWLCLNSTKGPLETGVFTWKPRPDTGRLDPLDQQQLVPLIEEAISHSQGVELDGSSPKVSRARIGRRI